MKFHTHFSSPLVSRLCRIGPRARWIAGLQLAVLCSPATLLLPGCTQVPTERTAAEISNDDEIIGRVRAALDASTSFKFPDVHILCFRGTVQLTGFVISKDQRDVATVIAKGVPGVMDVQNKISVRS